MKIGPLTGKRGLRGYNSGRHSRRQEREVISQQGRLLRGDSGSG